MQNPRQKTELNASAEFRVQAELRAQYERHPYPPVPFLALPHSGQGASLRYEHGLALGFDGDQEPTSTHAGKKILIAGAGTIEPLIIARMHPEAREIVALDFSESSLKVLKKRLFLARIATPLQKLAPIRLIHADLLSWDPGDDFDYIVASNLLHHLPDPAAGLARLSSWLQPGALLRMVTYPKQSRIWMRETSRWLKLGGLTAETRHLKRRARARIAELPLNHPVRSCFESHPEKDTEGGLIDAFLNAREKPLSPLEWKAAAEKAGLEYLGEDQRETSCSRFLEELDPRAIRLDPWSKLQILDDLLEICANPVIWFRKDPEVIQKTQEELESTPVGTSAQITGPILTRRLQPSVVFEDIAMHRGEPLQYELPSAVRSEMGAGLRRAQDLLAQAELSLDPVLKKLQDEVGPRVDERDQILTGLSIGEYPAAELMNLSSPWGAEEWDRLDQLTFGVLSLKALDQANDLGSAREVPGQSLREQAAWIQIRYGAEKSRIPIALFPGALGACQL